MINTWGIVISVAYILGLLLTAVPGKIGGIPGGAIALFFMGLVFALGMPRLWRTGPTARIWAMAGIVGMLAGLYFQWCMPQPQPQDVSRLIPPAEIRKTFEIQGEIVSPPRLTQSQRIQFELRATQSLSLEPEGIAAPQRVTGQVYVTVPLLQGTGLHPTQQVVVTGTLYQPKPATNPGGFDFQAYLAQQGIFTGMSGQRVEGGVGRSSTGLAKIHHLLAHLQQQVRQRIVQSQVRGLGVPEGTLLSAMLLGKSGVDVDYGVRDVFAQVGLAHALAASGFQVSLLVGIVLKLTDRLSRGWRISLGTGAIVGYIGLTGLEPSVLRAGVMGFAALLALTLERRIKPLGSILMAATLLLLFKPIWIWNLGFQLSFLATLGLVVTVPTLTQWLDWLPAAIAPFIAVPVAAYIWTLPLQLGVFGTVSLYSIPINVVTALLLTLISLGSGCSALVAFLSPDLGATLAGFLYYPVHGLIGLTAWGSQLPGNLFAVGTITSSQVVGLYAVYGLVWWHPVLQKRWWIAGSVSLGLVAIPAWYAHTALSQVTVLDTPNALTIVLQEQGKVTLISTADEADVRYTILPFLRQHGMNQIHRAIAPNFTASSASGWFQLSNHMPIRQFYGTPEFDQAIALTPEYLASDHTHTLQKDVLLLGQSLLKNLESHHTQRVALPTEAIALNDGHSIHLFHLKPFGLKLNFAEKSWLFLSQPNLEPPLPNATITHASRVLADSVLWWSGESLQPAVLETIRPQVAIAPVLAIAPEMDAWFQQHQTKVYLTRRDGAVQWSAEQGWATIVAEQER